MATPIGRYPLIAFAIAVLGCGGSETTAVKSLNGTYHLQTLNQLGLPVIILLTPTKKVEVTGSTVAFTGDKQFENVTFFRTTEGGQVKLSSEVCGGVYTYIDSQLTFTEEITPGTNCRAKYTGVSNGVEELAIYFDPTTTGIYRK
jgi:hypothetical protein